MTKESKFFEQETEQITAEEAERLNSPEVIGHEIVLNVKGWIPKALDTLSAHPGLMPAVDLDAPDWLDLSIPDHAIHEMHRVCMQLPRFVPPAKILSQLNEDEQNAVDVVYRIRQLHDSLAGLGVPASSAVVLIKAGLLMGVSLAQAHVAPWESFATIQYNAQTALISSNQGTPPDSPNALRAEDAKPEHRRWILAAKDHWAKDDSQFISDIARKLKIQLGIRQSERQIRRVIAECKPKKKVGHAC